MRRRAESVQRGWCPQTTFKSSSHPLDDDSSTAVPVAFLRSCSVGRSAVIGPPTQSIIGELPSHRSPVGGPLMLCPCPSGNKNKTLNTIIPHASFLLTQHPLQERRRKGDIQFKLSCTLRVHTGRNRPSSGPGKASRLTPAALCREQHHLTL